MRTPIYTGRTKFAEEIVAEFWMPQKPSAKAFIILDGCPAVPSKHTLGEFLARKGYWVFHPRYRGSWESGGEFLQFSPDEDVQLVALGLSGGFTNIWDGMTYYLDIKEINVIGASFGGAAALLASRYPEINKVIAVSPVTDHKAQDTTKGAESNAEFLRQIRDGFGGAYRTNNKNYKKLLSGKFFNPIRHAKEIDGAQVFIIHAKDDDVIPLRLTKVFAKEIGVRPVILDKGGHLSSRIITTTLIWKKIHLFLKSS